MHPHAGETFIDKIEETFIAVLLGLMTAITELGLRAPDDVSLVAIGDRDSFTPEMASVRIPQRELGSRAVAHLGGIMDGDDATRAERVPCEFHLGETLGPPPAP